MIDFGLLFGGLPLPAGFARRLRGGGKEAARRLLGGVGDHISPAQTPWSGALNKRNLGN